jgi:hypothetical protein
MASTQDVVNALDQIQTSNIHSIIVSFLIAAVALLILKIIAEAITGYIQLRLDQHVALGSAIEVYGKRGILKEVSLFTVTIETECGYVRVPTKSWRSSRFLILKDRRNIVARKIEDKHKGN